MEIIFYLTGASPILFSNLMILLFLFSFVFSSVQLSLMFFVPKQISCLLVHFALLFWAIHLPKRGTSVFVLVIVGFPSQLAWLVISLIHSFLIMLKATTSNLMLCDWVKPSPADNGVILIFIMSYKSAPGRSSPTSLPPSSASSHPSPIVNSRQA